MGASNYFLTTSNYGSLDYNGEVRDSQFLTGFLSHKRGDATAIILTASMVDGCFKVMRSRFISFYIHFDDCRDHDLLLISKLGL